MDLEALYKTLGLPADTLESGSLPVTTPIDGSLLAHVPEDSPESVSAAVGRAHRAFLEWRQVPPPKRGELIRLFGDELRNSKALLGKLVSVECGKILAEGQGEVQEMIDICDFALGLSRQLYGRTIASERPGHRMMETWHPLGPIGVISAFNFPVAVWSWNFAIALVCGDPVVWKPSEKSPLTALACQSIFQRALQRYGNSAPADLLQVVIGGADVGEALVDDTRLPLIAATGSCRMGRTVGPRVAQRLGRTLLELGGNNAMVVGPSADHDLAVPAILFSAVGTAGQRCTSLRRLIVHESIHDELVGKVRQAFDQATIGSPLDRETLVGPLIDQRGYDAMQRALAQAERDGGRVHGGRRMLIDEYPDAFYVQPALVEMPEQTEIVREETFAPILYVMKHRKLDEAIALHNAVEQGLSSAIFTQDLREAETFLSDVGSDCGIINVNIGPSGAEIGGAFGGEKATGGGREAGSDAWKAYMRRATNTINYSRALPLAQGIEFG